jgi:hypothetical protein
MLINKEYMTEPQAHNDLIQSGIGERDLGRIPSEIQVMSNREVYGKLRDWYRSNIGNLDTPGRFDSWPERDKQHCRDLVNALPDLASVTPLEIGIIFREIKSGNLEWAVNDTDDEGYRVNDYVFGRKAPHLEELSSEETAEIEQSPIRPYLFDKRPKFEGD